MGWLSRLLGATGGERDLLGDLTDAYRAEAEHAAHLRQHAARARYPQAGVVLQGLAEQEERHATRLRELIQSLGGGVPPIAPEPLAGHNPWARAVAAHKAAHDKRHAHVTRINQWDPGHPEVVQILREIEREDAAAMGVYDGLIMRSDPQSLD
jgi:hypothetical protein